MIKCGYKYIFFWDVKLWHTQASRICKYTTQNFIVRYITIQQAGIRWKISRRQSARIHVTQKHSNYSGVPFRARDFDLYLSRKGSRAERKHQFTSPLHLRRISGVLALQATGTVMRTGTAAHKLGRSAVSTQQVRYLCYLATNNQVQMEKLLDEFLNFWGRGYSRYLSISDFFILKLVSAVMNLRVPWKVGNFLTSCKPVSCSRRTLHHGVSK